MTNTRQNMSANKTTSCFVLSYTRFKCVKLSDFWPMINLVLQITKKYQEYILYLYIYISVSAVSLDFHFHFQNADASYDFSSNDPFPFPRYTDDWFNR